MRCCIMNAVHEMEALWIILSACLESMTYDKFLMTCTRSFRNVKSGSRIHMNPVVSKMYRDVLKYKIPKVYP